MKPEYVAPMVLYLCSEECEVSGYIFNCAAGYYNRAAFLTGKGVKIDKGDNVPTVEDIEEYFDEINDISEVSEYYNANEAIMKMFFLKNRRIVMAHGIRDKVAIIGMGCTKFGERWDVGAEELIVEAFLECLEDAKIDKKDIQAAWLGTCIDEVSVGKTAMPLSTTLRLDKIPVTRTENYCATGTEAFRGACYAVASGAYDICLALGVEKLKDTGYGGLPQLSPGSLASQWWPNLTAPGAFAQLASAYSAKYKIPMKDIKRAMAHISAKSHLNGTYNEKAHLRRAVTEEQVMASPIIAYPLGLFDCCGVSDGAAAAIVTTPEIAKN